MRRTVIRFLFFLVLIITGCTVRTPHEIYLDNNTGNDKNSGTRNSPIKTITELNSRIQKNPASVFFASGQTFNGTVTLKDFTGINSDTLTITSYGDGRATIDGGSSEAVKIENCRNILVNNLILKGKGRKDGNIGNGISFSKTVNCLIRNIDVSGFQKSGIDLYDCRQASVLNVFSHENGFSGINIMGSERSKSSKILIKDCKSENNPGDPTNLDNHSGNGILVGVSDSVMIDHCTATNNGWDMPRTGNGPVGIWAWESSHVTIQYCISYKNRTQKNAKDGGGFDLDGGVRNSVIQYCLSYENEGAGYGLFQYAGASPWSGNIIRYCVSINDAAKTEGAGSIFLWNGTKDKSKLSDCKVYNNVFYNTRTPLVSFENDSEHEGFIFSNNIFLGSGEVFSGKNSGSTFSSNVWWSIGQPLEYMGMKNFQEWMNSTGFGNNHYIDPVLNGPFVTGITDPYKLHELTGYCLNASSPLRDLGIIMTSEIDLTDFYGNHVFSGKNPEPGINELEN
jgi:hypothetical protein